MPLSHERWGKQAAWGEARRSAPRGWPPGTDASRTRRHAFALLTCLAFVLSACSGANPVPVASTPAPTAETGPSPAASVGTFAVPSLAAAPASPIASAVPSPTVAASGANLPEKAIIAAATSDILPSIAADNGFFAQHGVDVTVEQIAPATAMAALQTGEIQFSASAPAAVRDAVQGLPLRAVAFLQTDPFNLVTRPDVSTIADLKGQLVGGQQPPGDLYDYLQAALKTGGLTMDDVQMLNIGQTAPMYAALLSGQLAGGVVSYPGTQQLAAQGYHVLTGPDIISLPSSGLATSEQLLQNDPELVRDVLAGLLDGVVWAKANPDAATAYFAQKLDVSTDSARGAYQEQMDVLMLNITPDVEQNVLQRALPPDYSGPPISPDSVMDMSLYNQVAHQEGLS